MNEHESEFHDLIEQLKAERPPAPEPEHAFTKTLRGRLLGQYERKGGWEIGRLTNTATAIAVLALVIFAGWYLSSSQQPATISSSDIQTTRPAETAEAANQAEVIHSTLHVSRVVDETYTWQATVEHWQTADGQKTRTLVTDQSGQTNHFARSNGLRVWIAEGLNPIYSQHRRLNGMDAQHELYSYQQNPDSESPPFYSDLGWDGLAALMVSSELDCSTHECVKQMVEPALVDEALQRSKAYGWGISLIDTVEENGRTRDIYRIVYNHNISPEALPQYRQVKIDANTFEVISIEDYDGDHLMRSIELNDRQTMALSDLPYGFFTNVSEVIANDSISQMGSLTNLTHSFDRDVSLLGYEWHPSNIGDFQYDLFWHAFSPVQGDLVAFIHLLNEQGQITAQFDQPIRWRMFDSQLNSQSQFTVNGLANGRYQIYAGIYDQITGKNLLSEEGDEFVLVDTIIIEDTTIVAAEEAPTATLEALLSIADQVPLTVTADATNQLEAIHTILHVSRVVDESYTWEATVEHWQTADGRLNRTLVADENGQIDHFAQSDGSRLWLGNSLNPIYSPHRRLRSYFTFFSPASERTELNPPFYSDLGWDGLAALLVSSELDCSTYECVEQMVEPALVDEALQRNQAYGWTTSLIDTVEENGHTLRVFQINYHHNISSEALPQYRQVKIDANTFELVSIRDYDGEKPLRSIELVSQETVNLRLVDFQMIPEVVERTSLDGAIEPVQFGDDLQLGGYGLRALPPSFQPEPLALSFHWQADDMPESEFTGFVHILSEDGKLVAQHDAMLQWQPYPGGRGKVEAHFTFETKLGNGRYQIQVGVYNSATGQRLTTTEGITGVQIDEFVIEN